MNNLIHNSKRLAYLLRHSDMPDHNGWVKLDVVLSELGVSLNDLHKIVNEDTKGRFELSEDETSIRALYGHSTDVDLEVEPKNPPAILFHGTAEKYLDSIMNDGLKPRKRNYVHLSETIDTAIQVGTRHGRPVVLSIDTEAMVDAGYKFYKVQNGIWLTEKISPQFIKVLCYE